MVGEEFGGRGYGGVLEAGYWGAGWGKSAVTSFSEWCEAEEPAAREWLNEAQQ